MGRAGGDNPFAAIHGRVCYHPCETVCNRANLDSAVSIHAVERFLGDLALERGWLFDPPRSSSGKRVLVLSGEVERIAALGVRFASNHVVVDLDAERREGGFDAVFAAVGAHQSKRVEIWRDRTAARSGRR